MPELPLRWTPPLPPRLGRFGCLQSSLNGPAKFNLCCYIVIFLPRIQNARISTPPRTPFLIQLYNIHPSPCRTSPPFSIVTSYYIIQLRLPPTRTCCLPAQFKHFPSTPRLLRHTCFQQLVQVWLWFPLVVSMSISIIISTSIASSLSDKSSEVSS